MLNISDTFEAQCSWNSLSYLSSGDAMSYYFGIAILASTMTVVTIVVNCIFVATMLSQKLTQNSISNKLLLVLSSVDLLQGISIWPVAVAIAVMYSRFNTNCFLIDFNYFLGYHLVGLTIWTIFLITLEQYIAILHPYFYLSNVTFCRLLYPVVVIKVLLMITDIVGKIKLNKDWNNYYNAVVLAMWVPIMVAFVYMHAKIILCASRVAAKITNTNKGEGQKINARAKAARSGLIVLLATLVCYCPSIFYTIYKAKVGKPTPFITTFVQYPVELLVLFSSVVDPTVYYLRLKSLRRATKSMFASLCKSQSVGYE